MTIANSSGETMLPCSELFTGVTIGSDCAFAVLVEILQNIYYFLWKAVHPEERAGLCTLSKALRESMKLKIVGLRPAGTARFVAV